MFTHIFNNNNYKMLFFDFFVVLSPTPYWHRKWEKVNIIIITNAFSINNEAYNKREWVANYGWKKNIFFQNTQQFAKSFLNTYISSSLFYFIWHSHKVYPFSLFSVSFFFIRKHFNSTNVMITKHLSNTFLNIKNKETMKYCCWIVPS